MWSIISDLDGTLLDKNQQISQELITKIHRFEKLGGKFTIATGRTLNSSLPYIKKLDINQPVILYNGAMVYDPVLKEILYLKKLDPYHSRKIIAKFIHMKEHNEVSMLAFDHLHAYFLKDSDLIKYQLKKDGIEAIKISAEELLNKPLIKIMLLTNKQNITELKNLFSHDHPINSEPDMLEFIAKGINKGVAVKFLMNHIGIHPNCLVTVGDNENDIEMIRVANWGVAVSNAVPNLKVVSSFITKKTNNEQALIEVIEKVEEQIIKVVKENGGLTID